MPCVLPVISLKILGFVSQADEHPGKVARLGLTFAAGVVVSFLVLAGAVIALQAAGEHIGWGFQFQNPGFVAALAVVVFVFSLSLLGVFEIGGLAAIAGLGAAGAQRKEYADAFFHGILTTVLATPCTAPMLGAAIAFALSQPPVIIVLIFTTVALGLASPYVLLSLNPGWLKYVPRPGLWMDTFKQAMGFLLLATMVWLLFVFGAQTGADGLTWLLGFLLLLGFLCWVHGRFLNLASSSRRVAVVWLFTLVAIGVGYRELLHDTLFHPAEIGTGDAVSLSERVEVTEGGVSWEPFSVAYLEDSVADGRTVFIDFTADWCWTCKVNEKTVLADGDVEEAFLRNEVLTLKGDWTRKDPEITEVLKRHRRAGVPFYAIYPAGSLEDVIVLPEIINKKLVLESLEAAGPSRSGA
jgi:thiol:disulfide interchange protein DsbD